MTGEMVVMTREAEKAALMSHGHDSGSDENSYSITVHQISVDLTADHRAESRIWDRAKESRFRGGNDNAVIRCTSKSAEMIPMICGTVSRVAKLDCTVQEENCVGVGPFVSG
ncbi:hypothetical protein DPX16_22164 [Anabarilius grahami]|uniref:Uncharacterized protein n=1 Tax=Anabarilius grahami TaxID=495550 RepID=A0A3N0XR41_ANAGA|nr:hypothetical protein DPX16_22164 [Anabarilius grahami]